MHSKDSKGEKRIAHKVVIVGGVGFVGLELDAKVAIVTGASLRKGRLMIIDAHAHTFPRLGTPSGEDPVEVQLRLLQHHTYFHIQGWHRKSNGQPLRRQLLFDGVNPGINGMYDVNFRIGEYGRLEFTFEGEDYWLQWLPPCYQQGEFPPAILTTYMDYVGVDKAVLCPTHFYGELNAYTSGCVRRYPDRLVGIAAIREWKASQPSEIARLTRAVEELGLRGLHFTTECLCITDFQDDWSSAKYDPLWKEVRRLRIPIFWDIFSWGNDPWGQWQKETRRLTDWARRYSDIPSLVTHGLPVMRWPHDRYHIEVPEIVWELFHCPNIYVEVMLPGQMGAEYEYPYPAGCTLLKQLYQGLGPYKFVWGSDMPTIERRVTYKQSLDYLKKCDFLGEEEYRLLVGGNVARLLGL